MDDLSEDEAKRIVSQKLLEQLGLEEASVDTDRGMSLERYESEQIRDTYAHYGRAVYFVQVLEHEIVNLLVLARVVKAKERAEHILSDPWESRFRDTLGQLFRKLEPFLAGDKKLLEDLASAVRVRNQLAHSYWRDHAEDAHSLYGRAEMIEGLIEATDTFISLDERLSPVSKKFRESLGMTDVQIKVLYDEMIQRVQERDKDFKPSV